MQTIVVGSITSSDNQPLATGLRVLATGRDPSRQRWTALVSSTGAFSLEAGDRDPFESAREDAPVSLLLRVMDGASVLARRTVELWADRAVTEVSWILDGNRSRGPGLWLGGTVSTQDGVAAAGFTVVVERLELGSNTLLDRATVDADGRWATRVPTDGAPLDVQLRVEDAQGTTVLRQRFVRVQGEVEAELVLPNGAVTRPARFSQLTTETVAQLQGRALSELTPEERALVAGRLAQPHRDIERLAEDEAWTALGAPAGAIFAVSEATGRTTGLQVLRKSARVLSQVLDAAVEAGTVDAFAQPTSDVANQLREVAADRAVDEPEGQRRLDWLGNVGVQPSLARAITRLALLHTLDDDGWAALTTEHDAESVASARFAVELDHVGVRHDRLVALLGQRHAQGQLESTRALARLSRDEWLSLLSQPAVGATDGQTVGAPDDDHDEPPQDRLGRYADDVAAEVERRFPTTAVAHQWARSGGSQRLATLVDEHPQFELGRDRIDEALESGALRLDGDDAPALTAELRHMQRLSALGPAGARARVASALRDAGYGSATEVVEHGPLALRRRLADAVPEELVDRVYARARRKHAVVSAVAMRHHPMLARQAAPGLAAPTAASLPSLFGPMSQCGCTHCRSVLSPAAYLADLLAFLRRIEAPADQTLLDRIAADKHREDLLHVELSCANTHRPVPYIDLVNERLEAVLADNIEAAASHQTTWTDDELLLHPEYLDVSVYESLRDEVVHPLAMPFDLFSTECRAYLAKLDTSWLEVLSALAPPTEADALAVASERLGLHPAARRIVLDEHPATIEQMWGVDSLSELLEVPTVLRAADLDFDDLRRLLATEWFRQPVLAMDDPSEIRVEFEVLCQIEGATLLGVPTPSARLWGRAHRLVRLARHSGWTMADIDRVITALGGNQLTSATLQTMAGVERLAARLRGISHEELLAWWMPMAPDHYRRTWADLDRLRDSDAPLVMRPESDDAIVVPFEPELPRIAQVLGVPEPDLTTLVAQWSDAPGLVTVDSLSRVFRHVSIATAGRIEITEIPRWVAVLGHNPFESPAAAIEFFEAHDRLQQRGIPLDLAEYTLGLASPETLPPTEEAAAEWLDEITAEIRTANRAAPTDEASNRDRAAWMIAALVPAEAAPEVEAVLADGQTALPPEVRSERLAQWLGQWVDEVTRQKISDNETPRAEAADLLVQALAQPATRARERAAAVFVLARAAGVDAVIAQHLATTIELADGPLLEVLLDAAEASTAPLIDALQRFSRVAQLVAACGLTVEALSWLADHAAAIGTVAPAALPTHEGAATPPAILGRLADLGQLLGRAPEALGWLQTAIDSDPSAPVPADLLAAMAQGLSWPVEAATAIATRRGITVARVLDGTAIGLIEPGLALLQRTGLDATDLLSWATVGATATTARQIRNTVTTAIAADQRVAQLRPVRDAIREQQRDALVARYLALHPGAGGPAQIHGDLLIDPLMSACRMASRIQQGIAAVQLYVQRISLGLESPLEIPADEAHEWAWRRTYRVWEANRKVFLWPENWLDPQLRVGRTRLFDDALSSATGTQIDNDAAEQVVVRYLQGLRDMARLDVRGVGWDAGRQALHVVARQRTASGAWHYRSNVRGHWTQWEPITVEIAATEVLPLVHRGQLMLLWPTLEPLPEDREDAPTDPDRRIDLHWSFYQSGQWSEERTSSPSPAVSNEGEILMGEHRGRPNLVDTSEVALEAVVKDSDLRIVPVVRHGIDYHVVLGHFESDGCGNYTGRAEPEDTLVFQDETPSEALLPFKFRGRYQSFDVVNHDAITYLELPYPDPDGEVEHLPELIKIPRHTRVSGPRRAQVAQWEEWKPGFRTEQPFVYEDSAQSFVVWPQPHTRAHATPGDYMSLRFRFESLMHPHACLLSEQVARAGVSGMYRPGSGALEAPLRRQQLSDSALDDYDFNIFRVSRPRPRNEFDFRGGAYSETNWELFVHLPLALAARLTAAGRHEDARAWMQYIFDPSADGQGLEDRTAPERVWLTKPLWEAGRTPSIDDDLRLLSASDLSDEEFSRRDQLIAQIQQWAQRPFEPHVVARMRPGAYQRQVVMRYLDMLVGWGDSLFARGTTEAIDEASQLYLLAQQILGPRPQPLPERETAALSFGDLAQSQDEFSNALVAVENLAPLGEDDEEDGPLLAGSFAPEPVEPTHPLPPFFPATNFTDGKPERAAPEIPTFHFVGLPDSGPELVPYFCIPENDTLLEYWDRVEDRLFKIRNCLSLQGARLAPDLFAPPIDPGLLVEAVARGIDLSAAIDDLFAPLPHYRFGAALARAKELTSFVRDLGRSLLSALERRDGEALAMMQTEQELFVLEAVGQVRKAQIEEIEKQLGSLDKALEMAGARRDFISHQIETGLLEREDRQLKLLHRAHVADRTSATLRLVAGAVSALPTLSLYSTRQTPPTPNVPAVIRGMRIEISNGNVAAALNAAAEHRAARGRQDERRANRAGIDASYERRQIQWEQDLEQAQLEIERIEADRVVTLARLQVAQRELQTHARQTSGAQQNRRFLQDKYTNAELYDWMVGQVSQTHQQAFNLAVELARKAERAYRFELADDTARFVGQAYWDSQRHGLLAGDRLTLDLARMESAYADADQRERELVKRVSLHELDPGALLALRYGGACEFELPEELFALDHPGHYLRRIRSVALTTAGVTGPFAGTPATVTLLRSAIRPSPTGWDAEPSVDFSGGTESIALSTGDNDSGIFEGGADSRRRPFEGKGAISRWRVEFPALRAFDYRTLSDLIVEVRYTARDAGAAYADNTIVPTLLQRLGERGLSLGSGWARSWSVRDSFPETWSRFVEYGDPTMALVLDLEDHSFPFSPANLPRRLRRVHVLAEGLAAGDASVEVSIVDAAGTTTDAELSLLSSSDFPGTHVGSADLDAPGLGTLRLSGIEPGARDVVVLVEYGFEQPGG